MSFTIKDYLPDFKRLPADWALGTAISMIVSAIGTSLAATAKNAPSITSLGWLVVFVALAFAILALLAVAGWVAGLVKRQWHRSEVVERSGSNKPVGPLIDPFLPLGKRTRASILIDTNNWRARILEKSNIFEVKVSFIGGDRSSAQIVIIFDRWTLERGAVISTDNRLETYRTTEDAMTERYAIYSIHGINPPCIIDIEFQSTSAQPHEPSGPLSSDGDHFEKQRLAERQVTTKVGASQIEIVFDPADGRCVELKDDGVTWYSVGVRNGTDNRTIYDVSLRALQSDFAWKVLAVVRGQIGYYTGRPLQADPLLAEWPRLDPGATEYVQLFATPLGREDDEDRELVFRTVQQFVLEVRATDTKREVATFEYDPASLPALKKLA